MVIYDPERGLLFFSATGERKTKMVVKGEKSTM